jgi:hypothetical protein
MDQGNSTPPDWKQAAAREYAERRAEFVRQRDKGLKAIERMKRRLDEIETQLSDLDRGAKAFGLPVPEQHSIFGDQGPENLLVLTPNMNRVRSAMAAGRQFKDVALDLLAQAHPRPLKAAEVQEGVERELGREFHWKTAGMTLYRLSKEYKVTRKGQSWFFVPEDQREALRAADMLADEQDADLSSEEYE